MRVYCWNVRGARPSSLAWDMLRESSPDLALLQEVGGLPADVAADYQVVTGIPVSKHGKPQRFRTMILVRGTMEQAIVLASRWEWVNRELDHFKGNLVACHATIRGEPYRVMSVYSPAWPVDPARLEGTDVEPVKLKLNPKVWVTELLHAALLESDLHGLSAAT
jgi:exonuclease III